MEQQLQQNRFCSAWTALPIHGCWKGAISESPIISHTCTLFTCSRQKPETHRLVPEDGLISVTYSKNPSAMGNRKDTVKTWLGHILGTSAVTIRLKLSFKFWNFTHTHSYSPSVWMVLTFTGPLLFSEWRSHSNSQTVFWGLFLFFLVGTRFFKFLYILKLFPRMLACIIRCQIFIFQKLLCLEQFIQIHLNVKYMKSLISEQSGLSKMRNT